MPLIHIFWRCRVKDARGRDMRICRINTSTWEVDAKNRAAWRLNVKQGMERGKAERRVTSTEKRARKREKSQQPQKASQFVCIQCTKDCHSRIGLQSHLHRCRRNFYFYFGHYAIILSGRKGSNNNTKKNKVSSLTIFS